MSAVAVAEAPRESPVLATSHISTNARGSWKSGTSRPLTSGGDRRLAYHSRAITGAAHIRTAQAQDAAACAAVYAPYVLESAVSFEESAPSTEEMAARIAASHLWLVAESEGRVAGFAYAGRHQARAAYRWAAEVSVYLDPSHHRRGIGRALYVELIAALKEAGFCTLCAGITQPNEASNRLHASLGFAPIGTYERIGFKHGKWHDVLWLKLDLVEGAGRVPGPLRKPMLRGGAADGSED